MSKDKDYTLLFVSFSVVVIFGTMALGLGGRNIEGGILSKHSYFTNSKTNPGSLEERCELVIIANDYIAVDEVPCNSPKYKNNDVGDKVTTFRGFITNNFPGTY